VTLAPIVGYADGPLPYSGRYGSGPQREGGLTRTQAGTRKDDRLLGEEDV
jgi:hypothetical protein